MVVCRVCGVILGIIYTQKGGFLWHKNLSAKGGDVGPISGLGRFPGVGNGGPLQDFCLENPMERGAWWPTVPGTESDTTEKLCVHVHIHTHTYTYTHGKVQKSQRYRL